MIGVCRVGPDAADPHGREHWAEMLANPRKPVEHWHQLVEVSAAAPRAPRPFLHPRLGRVGEAALQSLLPQLQLVASSSLSASVFSAGKWTFSQE